MIGIEQALSIAHSNRHDYKKNRITHLILETNNLPWIFLLFQ